MLDNITTGMRVKHATAGIRMKAVATSVDFTSA